VVAETKVTVKGKRIKITMSMEATDKITVKMVDAMRKVVMVNSAEVKIKTMDAELGTIKRSIKIGLSQIRATVETRHAQWGGGQCHDQSNEGSKQGHIGDDNTQDHEKRGSIKVTIKAPVLKATVSTLARNTKESVLIIKVTVSV
jgi:hypothetical protein